MTIRQAILAVREEYLEHCENAAEINTGGCYAFADDVRRLFPNATIIIDKGIHAYLRYESRYYDAECPVGVSSRDALPFYQRMED